MGNKTKKEKNLIVKYSNRKLYCYRTSSYIKLSNLAGFLQAFPDTKFVTNGGEDITFETLKKIAILEVEKGLKSANKETLLNLIGLNIEREMKERLQRAGTI